MSAVQDEQIVEVNLVRIKDVAVCLAVHENTFGSPVPQSDGMPHFMNGHVPLVNKMAKECFGSTTCDQPEQEEAVMLFKGVLARLEQPDNVWQSHKSSASRSECSRLRYLGR